MVGKRGHRVRIVRSSVRATAWGERQGVVDASVQGVRIVRVLEKDLLLAMAVACLLQQALRVTLRRFHSSFGLVFSHVR